MDTSSTNVPTTLTNKDVLIVSQLKPEQLDKARQVAAQIKIEDSQAIVTFGVGAQKEISSFANNILEEVRSKDSGYVGEILTGLVTNVKGLDIDNLNQQKTGLAKLFSSATNAIKKFITKYEHLSTQLDHIIDELDKARMQLLRDITLLDNMYEANLQYLGNLDIFIAAGELKLQEFNDKILPEAKLKVSQSTDPMVAQGYQDLVQFVNRFEKKVHDLKLSRMIAIQSAPQLRMIQSGDQTLVEKIQSSILNTIPLWKNQIVIAITIFRQKKALEIQKEVTDTTNDLLKKNSELLKQGALEVANENERGIVDIDTLKKTNADLIATIEGVLKIQQEGKTKRASAEQELSKLELELKNTLKSV